MSSGIGASTFTSADVMRMHERESPRVQRLSWKCAKRRRKVRIGDSHPARFTVGRIPDNRPSARREVRTDLMRAAGDEAAAKEREADARRSDLRQPRDTREARGANRR